MSSSAFNPASFRIQFPEFKDPQVYPDSVLSVWWSTGFAYIDPNNKNGIYYRPEQAQLANDLIAAHLIKLNSLVSQGQSPGITQGATEGSVSVQLVPPPVKNGFKFWLNQTPYGQQLLALLGAVSSVGLYVGGLPERSGFRKWGGIF